MTTSETTNKALAVAEPDAHVAPKNASPKKGASQKRGAHKGHKAAKGGKPKVPKKGANTALAKKTGARELKARARRFWN